MPMKINNHKHILQSSRDAIEQMLNVVLEQFEYHPLLAKLHRPINSLDAESLYFYVLEVEECFLISELIEENEIEELFDIVNHSELVTDIIKTESEINYIDFLNKKIQVINTAIKTKKANINKSENYSQKHITRQLNLEIHYNNIDIEEKKIKELETAISIIKDNSANSFESLKSYTQKIYSINEPGVVSYSSAKLPGRSYINFYDRDLLDSVDDLVHENSHHHLNHILNFSELINESGEGEYYSPWRRSFRPVRGLYHAVFTFFMGCQLFYDLIQSNAFSKDKYRSKLYTRFIEEYIMLSFCENQIQQAFNNEEITIDGKKIMDELFQCLKTFKIQATKLRSSNEAQELYRHLEDINETYKLNCSIGL